MKNIACEKSNDFIYKKFQYFYGEMAQLGGRLAVDCEVGSLNPASGHRAKGERFLKNLSSHTVHSAECTGNCTGGLMSSFPLKRSLGRIKHDTHLLNRHWLNYNWILRFLSLAVKAVGIEVKLSK